MCLDNIHDNICMYAHKIIIIIYIFINHVVRRSDTFLQCFKLPRGSDYLFVYKVRYSYMSDIELMYICKVDYYVV